VHRNARPVGRFGELPGARTEALEQVEGGTAAIVVTRNRAEVLRACLDAIRRQDWAPDTVLVVDNGSGDHTAAMVRDQFPEAAYLRLSENLGFAGGLAAGMDAAWKRGYGWFWLLDDDSVPAPFALRRSMEVARRASGPAVVGLTGGVLRSGNPEFTPEPAWPAGPSTTSRSDWVHLDGAVVSRAAIDRVGYPRPDFFMMLEDVEYSNRMKRSGLEVVHFDLYKGVIERGNLGSGGDGGTVPSWRGYYQTRNQLLMAIDHRSLAEVIGWLYRQLKFIVGIVARLDRKGERLRLRGLGAWHALRGVRGRTVEPSAWRSGKGQGPTCEFST
jgi:rhamnopyranosyl-N-acetylglucosaminyl-diphospho-decaprenol beta-1,3/1,4-galactofuranosyltransferase